jgi:citrate synthase
MGDKTAKINVDGKDVECAVRSGSVGPDVIDIRKLYAQTGAFTFDPGFTSTASCESALTYIDGDEGVLLHRGYPIGQLAEHSSFMEVSHLLLNGELPNAAELKKFSGTISRHTMLIQCRSCAVSWGRFRRSTTIRPTSLTPSSG